MNIVNEDEEDGLESAMNVEGIEGMNNEEEEEETDEIQQSIKKILINVQKSKNLFDSKKTQEFLLNKESKIDALEG